MQEGYIAAQTHTLNSHAIILMPQPSVFLPYLSQPRGPAQPQPYRTLSRAPGWELAPAR